MIAISALVVSVKRLINRTFFPENERTEGTVGYSCTKVEARSVIRHMKSLVHNMSDNAHSYDVMF